MLFNSVLFLIFFLIVYGIYHLAPNNFRKYILLSSSMLFYATWDWMNFESTIPRFLIHFIIVIVINYFFVYTLERSNSQSIKKLLITIAVILNVLNLGFFKYFYFTLDAIGLILSIPGLKEKGQANFHIILPIAISFYTFQTIAFLVDKYRGSIPETTSFVDFALFIFFFPQQLAGPILKANEFLPRLKNPIAVSERDIWIGLYYIGLGIFKKGVLADTIAFIINPVFANPTDYSGLTLLLSMISFLFQLYGDFSGYSDMAIGCGKLLGFDLPQNFNKPFYSQNFSEMWERWHITLSRFLREYIFFPLGGSKVSEWRTNINLLITMTIAGIWHGANWNFIIWGIVISFSLIIERLILNKMSWWKNSQKGFLLFLKISIVLIFWFIIALIFRVNHLGDLAIFSKKISTWAIGSSVKWEQLVSNSLLLYFIQYYEHEENIQEFFMKYPKFITASISIILLFILTELSNRQVQFIYFQF
jgi:alginate O-acetyltransferase complex protein AlgI